MRRVGSFLAILLGLFWIGSVPYQVSQFSGEDRATIAFALGGNILLGGALAIAGSIGFLRPSPKADLEKSEEPEAGVNYDEIKKIQTHKMILRSHLRKAESITPTKAQKLTSTSRKEATILLESMVSEAVLEYDSKKKNYKLR